jgi:hypothetical protein
VFFRGLNQVARYNTLQQNAQTLNVNLANTVLARAKPEILRVIELLIDKMQADIVDLLVEVGGNLIFIMRIIKNNKIEIIKLN